jgi:nucleotide-binding universal stress UspA family protein
MVIRPAEGDTQPDPVIRRVVVPLDGSPLAAQALPTAAAIARQMEAPVHLVSAVDLSRLLPVELMPTVAFNGELYEEAVTQAKSDASQWLTQAALDLQNSGLDVSQEVRIGAPSTVIRDVLQPGDIIVLASRGHHGATRLALGSVAEQLVREAPVPVVLVPARAQGKSQASDHAVPALKEA